MLLLRHLMLLLAFVAVTLQPAAAGSGMATPMPQAMDHVGHHHNHAAVAAADSMPCPSHRDGSHHDGKCCDLACCGPACAALPVVVAEPGRLARAVPPAALTSDRHPAAADLDLAQRPPIAA